MDYTPQNLSTILTLRFLAKQMTLHRFILKGQVAKRLQFLSEESATRKTIAEINARFNRELDANPALRAQIEGGGEGEGESGEAESASGEN